MKLVEMAFFTDRVGEMAGFYQTLLNQAPVHQTEDMAIFMQNGVKIFIHKSYIAEEGDLPPENHTAFEVTDIDASCAELSGKGLQIEREPADYYWGRSAYLRNPDGHLIELIAPQ